MLIRITIDHTQPLAGTAATGGSDPVPFDGWLELLRVLSDLVAATPSGAGEAGAAEERPRGNEPGASGGG